MSRDATKLRILETAGPIFADRGYAAATVRAICNAANVNIAAVNYHFGGKEQLYREVLELVHAAGSRDMASVFGAAADTLPAARLRLFVRGLLTHLLNLRDEPWETRLMMREVLHPTLAGKAVLRAHARRRFELLRGIIADMLPRQTPPHRVHQIVLSVLGQCLYYRAASKIIPLVLSAKELRAHYHVDALTHHIVEFSLAAISALAAGRPAGYVSNGKASNSRNLGKGVGNSAQLVRRKRSAERARDLRTARVNASIVERQANKTARHGPHPAKISRSPQNGEPT